MRIKFSRTRISWSPLPGESWHLRSRYMIRIRLPWRPRARPSATLHEIPACSLKSKLEEILLPTEWSVKGVVGSSEDARVRRENEASSRYFLAREMHRYAKFLQSGPQSDSAIRRTRNGYPAILVVRRCSYRRAIGKQVSNYGKSCGGGSRTRS